MEYLSTKSLAKKYDLSIQTIQKKLKKLPLINGEHYIMLETNIRYNASKIHDLLISKEERELSDNILERLLV